MGASCSSASARSAPARRCCSPHSGPPRSGVRQAGRSRASPRNTVLGHLAGVLAGLTGLAATGLLTAAPDLTHPSWARVGAAALALGVTCAAMAALGTPHPPAGATTLIIALGLLHTPSQILAVLINKLFGVPYPWWHAQCDVAETSAVVVSGDSG